MFFNLKKFNDDDLFDENFFIFGGDRFMQKNEIKMKEYL